MLIKPSIDQSGKVLQKIIESPGKYTFGLDGCKEVNISLLASWKSSRGVLLGKVCDIERRGNILELVSFISNFPSNKLGRSTFGSRFRLMALS